jgi:uncharacterized protein YceK
MKKTLLLMFFVLLLSGCGTVKYVYVPVREQVTIPSPPKVVIMDNGKFDKKKYPDTDWVKEPTVDLKNGKAYWSFEDIEKISTALTKWPNWGLEVEKTLEIYNKGATNSGKQGETQKKHSWYRFWE